MTRDPYKYFRVEARELLDGLVQGTLQLEKGAPAPEVLARLLRLAHTLKGAARVVKQPAIAELTHTVEGVLTSQQGAARPLSGAQGSELLQLFDQITTLLQALETAPGSEVARPTTPPVEETTQTVRVEIEELDSLLRGVGEVGLQVEALRKDLGTAERLRQLSRVLWEQLTVRPGGTAVPSPAALGRVLSLSEELRVELDHLSRGLAEGVERVDGGLAGLQEVAQRLRLIPAHTVFPSLDRAVRDAAHELGKRVEFEAVGGEVRLDAQVLASLRDALMHVVRNAVAHGIEADEAQRVAAGKPPWGRVRLAVERRGGRVTFLCHDDGRGVDVEAVRRAAVTRGLVQPLDAPALSVGQLLALLQTGGLTTSGRVTELSGRGIGLDVVRATTASLKGELRIRSEPGHGVTVEVQVPVTIASLQGLVVEAGGATAAIPLDSVRQTLRVKESDVARSADRDSILHQGNLIPFLPLERALGRPAAAGRRRRAWSAVVVQVGNRSAALGVDRLLGTSHIVMRTLPGVVEADPVVAGASLDAQGNPQLVLDPSGLVEAALRGAGAVREEAAAPRAPVLVIDDSLTTRMLEQSILESAGYEVELAVSAEEGLTRARERRYSLFVVDVEMPGMDGFGFVAEARADAALREIPSILVTSRNAPEDRRRGEEVGARAYIVKGEFDQGQLLKTIRRLIG